MANETNHSLNGCWYGNYYYASAGDKPYGFEAVFIENAGSVSGNILDLGVHGEASVTGTFSSGKVSFTKVYYKGGGNSVLYEGMMSEDGKMLSGQWQIPPLARGNWIAWRVEEKDNLEEMTTDTERDAEREAEPQVAVAR
jgi:hypothetical protein